LADIFFSTDPTPPALYPLSLHDALPICRPVAEVLPDPRRLQPVRISGAVVLAAVGQQDVDVAISVEIGDLDLARPFRCRPHALRSEEHTSELQSRGHLVCRLLLEKKQKR